MKSQANQLVLAYWHRLRQKRDTPDQIDLDPNELKPVFASVFLLEAGPDRTLIYRLAGAAICERYKSELVGQAYLRRWNPKYRTRLTEMLFQSLSLASPLCIASIGPGTATSTIAESETIFLPMTSGTIRRDRFLCATEMVTETKEPSMRPMSYEHLVSAEFISGNANADLGTKRA